MIAVVCAVGPVHGCGMNDTTLYQLSSRPSLYVQPGFCDNAQIQRLLSICPTFEQAEDAGLQPIRDEAGVMYEFAVQSHEELQALIR